MSANLGGTGSSLLKLVDFNQCECLNESATNSLAQLLKGQPPEQRLLFSDDDDPQLLISLGFSVPVRLTGLRLRSPPGSADAGEAPRRLRLFFNAPTKSFGEAEGDTATDEFDLPQDSSALEAGITLALKSVRYQNVASLQIFVAENGGGLTTKISELDIFGAPVDNLQMKDWKPLKPEEIIAPNDT